MNYRVTIAMPFGDDCDKTMYGEEVMTEEQLLKYQEAIEKLTGAEVSLCRGAYQTPSDSRDDYFLKELLLSGGLDVEEVEGEPVEQAGYSLFDVLADYFGWEAVQELEVI